MSTKLPNELESNTAALLDGMQIVKDAAVGLLRHMIDNPGGISSEVVTPLQGNSARAT